MPFLLYFHSLKVVTVDIGMMATHPMNMLEKSTIQHESCLATQRYVKDKEQLE